MMPDVAGCWPDLGEMDILEMINGDGRVHATYHWNANYPAKNCSQVRHWLPLRLRCGSAVPLVVDVETRVRRCALPLMHALACIVLLPVAPRAHTGFHFDSIHVFHFAFIHACTQPDGHKMRGSYANMSTWDSQFHGCARALMHYIHMHHHALHSHTFSCITFRYALERGPQHVAFVNDGLLLLNVSLAAFPDVKLWQVRWCCGEGGMGRRQCPAVELTSSSTLL